MSIQAVEDLNALMDWDSIVAKATDGMQVREVRQSFAQSYNRSRTRSGGIARQIIDQVGDGGQYRPIRVYLTGSTSHVYFRSVHSDSRWDYHRWTLSRRADGKVLAENVFFISTGDTLSEKLRWFVLVADEALRNSLGQDNSELYGRIDLLIEMGTKVKSGEGVDALRIYQDMPEVLRLARPAMLLRIAAAQYIGAAEQLAALDGFRSMFPNEATGALLIDYYRLKQRFGDALHSLDRLKKLVGDDAYLDVVRAGIQLQDGEFIAARKSAMRAIAREDLEDGYWSLLDISLAEKSHAETVDLLQTIGTKFEYAFGDLNDVPQFAEFVKSPEYRAWLESGAATGDSP